MSKMVTLSALLTAALVSLAGAQGAVAATGANNVASPTKAPWSVHVLMTRPGSEVAGACSGSILSPTRIVTAGHCITSDDGVLWPEFEVRAGITTLEGRTAGQEQSRFAVRVSSDPFYVSDTFVHDVAVLEVEPPFDFSTPYVQPISVASHGPSPATGLRFFGWGDIAPEIFAPEEHELELTALPQWQCPAELQGDPSFMCLRSATGSPCPGDSGSGVVDGDPPQLAASISLGTCTAGEVSGATDLTSPEIRDWLSGNPAPPRAPEGRRYPLLLGTARVGGKLRCEPASWSGNPRLTTAFVELRDGHLLQEGSSTEFEIPRSSLRRKIACVSIATDAGGRTEMRSSNERLVLAPR